MYLFTLLILTLLPFSLAAPFSAPIPAQATFPETDHPLSSVDSSMQSGNGDGGVIRTRQIKGEYPPGEPHHGWHITDGPPIRRAEGVCEEESPDFGDDGDGDAGSAKSARDPVAGVPVAGGMLGGLDKRRGPLERLSSGTGVAAPAGSLLDSVPFLGLLLGRALGVVESGIRSPEVDGGRGLPDRAG